MGRSGRARASGRARCSRIRAIACRGTAPWGSVILGKSEPDSFSVAGHELEPGLYEALLTGALDTQLADLVVTAVSPELRPLADAEAADRVSRHIAAVVTRAIEAAPEQHRAQVGASIADKLLELLSQLSAAIERDIDLPPDPQRL